MLGRRGLLLIAGALESFLLFSAVLEPADADAASSPHRGQHFLRAVDALSFA